MGYGFRPVYDSMVLSSEVIYRKPPCVQLGVIGKTVFISFTHTHPDKNLKDKIRTRKIKRGNWISGQKSIMDVMDLMELKFYLKYRVIIFKRLKY